LGSTGKWRSILSLDLRKKKGLIARAGKRRGREQISILGVWIRLREGVLKSPAVFSLRPSRREKRETA